MKISSYQQENYINNINNQQVIGCLLFGPEKSLIDFFARKIAGKIVQDINDQFLVANINEEVVNNNSAIINDEFYSFSMLGGRKLIIIDGSNSEISNSIKSILSDEKINCQDSNFILIKAGDLSNTNSLRKICEASKIFAAIGCYEETDFTAKKFIADQLKNKKINFSQDIIEVIFEKTGRARDVINLEIEKIDLYLAEKRNIDIDLLQEIIANQSQISVNIFINNFVEKNYGAALNVARKLFENDFNAITLIRYLLNYLQKLYDAKIDIEQNKINIDEAIKRQGIFFKLINDFKKHLNQKNLQEINRQIYLLQNSEILIKKGSQNQELIFCNFLLNYT